MTDDTTSESSRILSELAPNSIPHWANVVIVRCAIALVVLGLPSCGAGVVGVGWKAAVAFQDQAHEIQNLGEAVQGNSESIRELIGHHRRMSEEEIRSINLKLAQYDAAGILPKAERQIEELKQQVSELQREIAKRDAGQ